MMNSLIFTRLYKLTAYYALDFSYPAYDYDGVGNMIAYDDYVKNDYAADCRRDEGYNGGGCYDDDVNVYASWRLG